MHYGVLHNTQNIKTLPKLLAGLAICATVGTSQAALLVYESFQGSNYVAGNTLIGVTAQGTGLTGTWAQATADANQNWTVGNNSTMSYSGGNVSVSGGTKYAIGNYTGGTAAQAAHIQLATGLASTTGNTFYMSFLFRMSGTLDLNDQIMLDVANTNSTTPIGKFGFRDNNAGDQFFIGNSSSGAYMASPAASMDTTYFGVVKFTTAGVNTWDTATLFINPASTTVEGGAGSVSYDLASASNTPINYFGLRLQQADSSDFLNIDEVRIGETWSDVVIPEPTTWALLAGSLTCLVVFRRRRNI